MTITRSDATTLVRGGALSSRRRALGGLAGMLALAASAFLLPGAGTALAAGASGWEQGCAYKHPSGMFGNGTAIEADYCSRLRSCRIFSEQGRDPALTGCVGFEQPGGRRADRS